MKTKDKKKIWKKIQILSLNRMYLQKEEEKNGCGGQQATKPNA